MYVQKINNKEQELHNAEEECKILEEKTKGYCKANRRYSGIANRTFLRLEDFETKNNSSKEYVSKLPSYSFATKGHN